MQIKCKTIYAAFIIAAMIYPPFISARTGRQEITAGQQEQIRAVGRALLQAKRSAKPDKDVDLLRADVKQARSLLEELIQSFGINQGRLTIQRQGQKKSRAQASRADDKFLQIRADRIKQLRQVFFDLADRSQLLAPEKSGSLRLPKTSPKRVVPQLDTMKVAGRALTRLENLPSLMDDALLQPPVKRLESLKNMARDLTMGPHPVSMLTQARPETPTMTTRTRHRRLGNR